MANGLPNDFDLIKQWHKHHKATKDGLARQYKNTEDCNAFYAGDYMDFWIGSQSTDQFGVKKRAMVQINKVKPYVNAVKGFFAQNRREAKYSARLDGQKIQELYSQYANGLRSYIRRQAHADQVETQQDGDMLNCGYGCVETAMTYTDGQATTNPNGQILKGRIDPLEVGWDPFAKAANLTDRRWDFAEKIYDLNDAIDLFQDARADDFESATDDELKDGEGAYKFYARGGRYNKIKETALDWSDQKNEKVKVYFYEWFKYEKFWRCENPATLMQDPRLAQIAKIQLEIIAQDLTQDQQDMFAFDSNDEILSFDDEVKKKIEEKFSELEIYEYRKMVFYGAVISKDHVFTKYKNPCQTTFTRNFKTGDYDAKNKIWTGMVNSMKEPTLYENKALTELMFIIGANSKGGVYIEEDAVDDVQKFEQQYSKTDAVIVVNPGAIAGEKIKSKKEPQVTTGYEGIIQMSAGYLQEVNGFDKSFFGSVESKQETGVLYKRRIRQIISLLACYADAITLYQILDARLDLDYMRIFAENNSGGLFPVSGVDGKQQFLQISKDKLATEYDVNIDEAPQSAEEKEEYAKILSSMADKLVPIDPQSAKALYGMAAKYLPLDQEDKDALMQMLMPKQGQIDPQMVAKLQQQVQQLMSQATQTQLAEVASKAALNQARAKLDTAKIQEVVSKSNLDNAKVHETGSIILKNKAQATHDLHEGYLDEKLANKPQPESRTNG
jgi:hypothetical protein